MSRGRAIVFPQPGVVELEEFDLSAPAAGQVLVRAEVSSVSAGTELSYFLNAFSDAKYSRSQYPLRPGYASVGFIEAVGPNVTTPKVGERVLTMGNHASHYLCTVRTGAIEVIPPDICSDFAALAVLAQVALAGVQRHPPQIGQSALVTGQGVIGQLLVQFLRAAGCRPIMATDLREGRLEKSRISGAHLTINAAREDVVASVKAATDGRRADLIYDVTRTAKALPLHFQAAATRGTIVIVGALVGTVELNVYRDFMLRELTLVGTYQPNVPKHASALTPWTQQGNRKMYMDFLREGTMKVSHLITHKVKPHEAPRIYEMLKDGGKDSLGILFDWT